MTTKNLLVMIIDTNPLLWSSLNSNRDTNKIDFNINDYLNACVGFLNAYMAMSRQNSCAVIASHYKKAEFLYPTRSKQTDKNLSPWAKCEQINDIDDQIKENLKILSSTYELNEDMDKEVSLMKKFVNNSTLTSALGLALCYINRIERKFKFNDEISYRILIVKLYEDTANQYMNLMNMIFSAEKLNIPIDTCILMKDSSLLQQASNLTNGIYFNVPKIDGLLNYLLWLYLPNEQLRKILVQPPKIEVDYRAACFCHRKLVDIGYVCSVCLSVFCSFTPICSTCDSTFEFDVNILKLGKKFEQQSQTTKLKQNEHSNSEILIIRGANSGANRNLIESGSSQSNDYHMSNENSSSMFDMLK